jgi:chromosome partitioning protein
MQMVLAPLKNSSDFQYAILDCPPSLGILMTAALASADELLVPLQCEYFGLEGLSKIVDIAQQIRESGANPNLKLEGIVMTMFDSRVSLANQVVREVKKYFEEAVYESVIPRTVRLGEAPGYGKAIIEYPNSGIGAAAYRALAAEFLSRRKKKK